MHLRFLSTPRGRYARKSGTLLLAAALAAVFASAWPVGAVFAAGQTEHGKPIGGDPGEDGRSIDGSLMSPSIPAAIAAQQERKKGHGNGRSGNSFANDPCLDPPPSAPFPTNFFNTVQSETELAVLNTQTSKGEKIVVGYNDSFGFSDNREGLSGYAFSIDGGKTFIDGGGLPPEVATGVPAGTPGADAYFGDPVLVVHNPTQTFYYASIYQTPDGLSTLSVNRGRFVSTRNSSAQGVESVANTRCEGNPSAFGVADPPKNLKERMVWDKPVVAVLPPFLGASNDAFLDKEWLYVDQKSGTLYLTYTRFSADGETPIEMVRCLQCAFRSNFTSGDFTPPSTIVPNLADTFNQASQPFVTPTGRVIVTFQARQFALNPPFQETSDRVDYAVSDTDGASFGPVQTIASVNPQGEPRGYNRGRATILNAPYLFVNKGVDDGDSWNRGDKASKIPGFGNVYVAYFSGKTPLGQPITKAADIFVSTSTNDGGSFTPPVKVNDDDTNTTHVFPSVQANRHGDVFVAWIDRRQDPGDNILNDTWAAVSKNEAQSFGSNKLESDVSTSWFVRSDARPNFGDYNSSEMLDFDRFVTTWADGRFPPGTFIDRGNERLSATPDTLFDVANGLGSGKK